MFISSCLQFIQSEWSVNMEYQQKKGSSTYQCGIKLALKVNLWLAFVANNKKKNQLFHLTRPCKGIYL